MESVFQLERQNNIQFVLLLLLWQLVGMFAKPLAFIVIPVTLIYFANKSMYIELFAGFFFMIILSDNRSHYTDFAQNVKVLYMLFMIFILFRDSRLIPKLRDYLPFIPFFAVAFFCVAFSPIKFTAIEKTFSYAMLILLIPAYVRMLYEEYGDYAIKFIVYFVSWVLFSGFVFRFIMPGLVTLAGRYRGILGNPDGLGLFCGLFFLFFSIVIEYKGYLFSNKERAFVYGVIFLSLILSGSRGGLFAILMFLAFKRIGKISNILNAILLVVVALSYNYMIAVFFELIKSLGLDTYLRAGSLESGSGRLVAWAFGWQHVKEHIWLGKGFAYTSYLYYKYREQLSLLGHQGNAHNSYLTIWLNTGLIGLVTFVIAWFSYFQRAAKNSYLAYPLMFVIAFSSFIESWLTASLNPYTLQLLMMLALLTDNRFITKRVDTQVLESPNYA